MIPKTYQKNFSALKRAANNGDLALVDCQDRKTGKRVIVIAAVQKFDGAYDIIPLAKMFNGNPYKELNPPCPGGGYSEGGGK